MRQPRLVILAALLLAGCATARTVPPPAANPSQAAVPQEVPTSPPELPAAKERPPQRPIDPKKLVGLTRDETRSLIGEPATVHDEPPAVIWSYGSEGCKLDVFFYPDVADQSFKALTYDMKPKGVHGLSGAACLASLRTTAR